MFGRSLRAKIFLAFVVASIVPLLAAVWMLAAVTDGHLRAGALREAGTAGALARTIAAERGERLVATAQTISLTPGLADAIAAGDRAMLLRLTQPWNGRLGTATVAVVDDRGVILVRAYAPDRYGDDVAATTKGLRPALRGQPGFSMESAGLRGLAIRGFGPVQQAGRTVGVATVTQNLDREFLASLREAVGLETFAVFPDGTTAGASVDPELAARLAWSTSAFTGFARVGGEEQAVHAWPLSDPDGAAVGYLGIVFPLNALVVAQEQVHRAAAVTALAALVGAGLLGWLLSRALLGPVERLTRAASAIARGGAPAIPVVRTGDELQDLGVSLERMVETLSGQARRLSDLNARLEEQWARDQALAAAAHAFAAARLDTDTVLRAIAQRVAELVEGGCVVRELSEDGRWLTPVAFHHVDPEALAFWRGLLSAPQPADAGLNGRAVSTGEVQFLPRLSPEEAREAILPEHWPYVDRFGIGGLLVVPLRAGGRTFGTVSAQRDAADRPFTEDDRAFLRELADRAALTVENARLYQLAREEITQRRRAEETQRFLAYASRVLAGSLDYEETLRTVAGLAVPGLADWCTVNLLAEDGSIRRVAIVCAEPAKQPLARELEAKYPLDPDADHGVPRVIRTGQTELISEVPEEVLQEFARDADHLRLLRQLGLGSFVSAPLVVGGQPIGALGLGATEPGRFGSSEAALLEELARRAATAIENARLYQEARAAVRMRDEFLSVAAHELRTPITSLRGFAQLLTRQVAADGTVDPQRLTRALDQVTRQTQRLTALIDQLLDATRLEAGKLQIDPRTVDVSALVEELVGRLRGVYGDHLLVLRAPEPAPAWVDPLRLEQVVTNLIDNAAKFSPRGTPIEIEVRSGDGDSVRLAVRDHGIGVPPEQHERVFERFAQVHGDGRHGGLGIGLYVSREIVQLHGGTIAVETPEDGGTRFLVHLPVGAATEAEVVPG